VNRSERKLLNEEVGGAEPRLCIRSATRIDAGRWLRKAPVWLCIVEDMLVILAVARRRYVDGCPLDECQDTHYNHATGELVIAPAEGHTLNRFAVSPSEALQLMAAMGFEEPADA
jgi:hypothetical protein